MEADLGLISSNWSREEDCERSLSSRRRGTLMYWDTPAHQGSLHYHPILLFPSLLPFQHLSPSPLLVFSLSPPSFSFTLPSYPCHPPLSSTLPPYFIHFTIHIYSYSSSHPHPMFLPCPPSLSWLISLSWFLCCCSVSFSFRSLISVCVCFTLYIWGVGG